MAEQAYFEHNTSKEQGSNLRYLYDQLGLDQVFKRLAALEEKVSGVEVQDYPTPALVGQPPRPDYISENEPISVDTPRPVDEHTATKNNREDEHWDLVQDRTPASNVEDDTRLREQGDVPVEEDEVEKDETEFNADEQLALFDEHGNVNDEARSQE
jgi:hypothetical protein